MKDEDVSSMVLRTFYLSRQLDDKIKFLARERGISKNQLIREAVVAMYNPGFV